MSVYDIAALSRYLADSPTQSVAAALATRFGDRLCFECQTDVVRGGTRTIHWVPRGETLALDLVPAEDREQAIALFRESAHTDLTLAPVTPEDVAIRTPTGMTEVDAFMRRLAVLVSAAFLANHCWFKGEAFHYRLIGYKVVEGQGQLVDLLPSHDALVRMARWCYSAGGQSDKIGLARNVISIYATSLGDLAGRAEIWHGLMSNYQIYLKHNVENYLALKGRLSDMLMDASARTQTLAGTILDALRNGIYVLLTFVLTVVVVNAVKDMSVTAVFSVPYIIIALIVSGLLTAWVAAAAWHAVREYDSGAEALRMVVRENYGAVLAPEELTRALDPAMVRNRHYLVRHAWQHTWTWLLLVALMMGGLLGGRWWTSPAPKPAVTLPALTRASLQGPQAPLLVRKQAWVWPQGDWNDLGVCAAAGCTERQVMGPSAAPTKPSADLRSGGRPPTP